MILLSVIIPAYNCEKTIKKCLDNIINESFSDDFEIIIINDGSTDSTLSICREYEQKYSFIKIIDKKNDGVSAARNDGIRCSQGKYIAFVDSDDFVESCFTEKLISNIKTAADDTDLIIFNSYSVTGDKKTINIDYDMNSFSRADFQNKILYQQMNEPWGKVFKSEIIHDNNIMFDSEIWLGEDFEFLVRFFSKVRKTAYIDTPLYYYIIGAGSLSHSVLREDILVQYGLVYEKQLKNLGENTDLTILNSSYINLLFRKIILDGNTFENINIFKNYMKKNDSLKKIFKYKYSTKTEIKKIILKIIC